MNIALLILAAGSSSRMHQPKQVLPVGDTTLLSLVIQNALKTIVSKVFVVLGAELKVIKNSIQDFPIQIIYNSNYKKGLSSSIVKGIKELLDYDAVLILLGDQPKIDSIYLNEMVLAFKKQPRFIIASEYDGINGVPAIFPKKFYSELLKLEGDKGAKTLLNSDKLQVVKSKNPVNLLDIDTPQDYQKLIRDIE